MKFFKKFLNTSLTTDFDTKIFLELERNREIINWYDSQFEKLQEEIRNLTMRVLFLERAYNTQAKQIMELIQDMQKKENLEIDFQ